MLKCFCIILLYYSYSKFCEILWCTYVKKINENKIFDIVIEILDDFAQNQPEFVPRFVHPKLMLDHIKQNLENDHELQSIKKKETFNAALKEKIKQALLSFIEISQKDKKRGIVSSGACRILPDGYDPSVAMLNELNKIRKQMKNKSLKDITAILIIDINNNDDKKFAKLLQEEKSKPKYSPTIKSWTQKGGTIDIDENGVWHYTTENGVTVAYKGKSKLKYYPTIESWMEKGGAIDIDENGVWHYTTKDGVTVTYKEKTKPKYSPIIESWMEKGGTIDIDENDVWHYTTEDGVTVAYPDGYPDFKSAGLVLQEIDLEEFKTTYKDFNKADEIAEQRGNPRDKEPNTWHHHQNCRTMQEIDKKIHSIFTHSGGMSIKNNNKKTTMSIKNNNTNNNKETTMSTEK